jgi:hypothetical protein
LCLDDLFLEILKISVIQVELPFQRPIGYPPLALEQRTHLLHNLVKFHSLLSATTDYTEEA